jgi:serine/threonine protein kinase
VLARIGTGGMAEVFKCRLSGIGGFDKLVVVKRIRPDLAGDPHFVDMFLDEARIAANLNHSNIIQIYEIDQVNGVPYISMEYVRGPTFSQMMREQRKGGTQNLAVAAKVMSGICAALDYAHNAVDEQGNPLGVIHRDVSPQNIIVSLDGVPKLLDFGVAKAKGQIAHTNVGSVKGKFVFMAPEQFLGKNSEVTRSVDIFAAGVCLYQATTLQLPYKGNSELEVMHAAALGEYPKPSELISGFCPRMEKIILWAMAPKVKDRCPDALTLHHALEEYAAEESCTHTSVVRHVRDLFPTPPPPPPGAQDSGCDDILSSDIVDAPGSVAPAPSPSFFPSVPSSPAPPEGWAEAPRTGSSVRLGSVVMRSVVRAGSASAVRRTMPIRAVMPPVASAPPWRRVRNEPEPDAEEDLDIEISEATPVFGPRWVLLASVALGVLGIATGALLGKRTQSVEAVEAEPAPSVVATVTPVRAVAPAGAKANPESSRLQKTLAAAKVALAQGRYVEAASLAQQVLSEQIDEPAALAVLAEASEQVRRGKSATVRPPPPAPPAPVRNGALTIETEPLARVFLNGKALGWSPIRRQVLADGVYRVRAEQARREPVEQEVRVVGGRETMLKLQLAERPEPARPVAPKTAPIVLREREREPEPEAPPPPPPAPVAEAMPEPVVVAPAPVARSPVTAVALPPVPAAAVQAVAIDFDCPDGGHLAGAPPPKGTAVWCEAEGEKNGKYVRFFPSGKKAEEGEFRRGKKHGRWIDFYEQGGERGRIEWRKGVQSW